MAEKKYPLKRDISRLREIIIKDFARILDKIGFDINGDVVKEVSLSQGERDIKERLLKIEEIYKASSSDIDFLQYIEDSSRTILHILLAFKTMEARGLMPNLISELLGELRNDLEILPDFKKADSYAYLDFCDKFEDEIEELENKFNSYEDDEYYKFIYLIRKMSKQMAEAVPLLFKDLEHTLIYPDFVTIKEIFNILSNIPQEEYLKDDFLGWVYQYWVDVKDSEIKTADKDKKIGFSELVYASILKRLEEEQTQFGEFYTPKWVVKYIVDNTLKPYWEGNKKIEEIKLLDPACGAGNFLVYSFDLFYDLWKQEHPELPDNTIINNILQKNIHGVDIQAQPLQITALNLWLKAKKKAQDVKIENMNLFKMNVLKASSLYRYENEKVDQLSLFETAVLEEEKAYKSEDIGQYINAQNKLGMIKAKQFFSQKFEVIVMNPPFLSLRKLDVKTAKFLKKEYPSNYHNLFAAFVERAQEICKRKGYIGFISSDTFMNLGSFEYLRKLMLTTLTFKTIISLGRDVFEGPAVSASIFISQNLPSNKKSEVCAYDLSNNKTNKLEFIDTVKKYNLNQDQFLKIKGFPFLFTLSSKIREIFLKEKSLLNFVEIKQGMITGDNEKFLKLKWEIPKNFVGGKYHPYAKGGGFSRYANEIEDYIYWENDGQDIKREAKEKYGSETRTVKNQEYFFREGLTYSKIGLKGFSVRYLPEGCIFDVAGSCIFSSNVSPYFLMAYLNSSLVSYILSKLNPNPNFEVGDVERVPFKLSNIQLEEKIEKISNSSKVTKEKSLGFNYLSDFYHQVELYYGFDKDKSSLQKAFMEYLAYYETLEKDLYYNEFLIDEEVFNLYEITPEDRDVIEEEFGKSAYSYAKVNNPETLLSKEELESLYCVGKPTVVIDEENEEGLITTKVVTIDGKKQTPLSVIEIAEFKQMNPEDVLALRIKYGIYRDKDLLQAILNWLRAIVKDSIKETNKLYLDEDIEKLIKQQIEAKYSNGSTLIDEIESICAKPLIDIVRAGLKIGSSATMFGADPKKGSKDTDEPLLQQNFLAGTGASRIVVFWFLQDFLLEFEPDKKYTMQNEIRRIKERLESRLLDMQSRDLSGLKTPEIKNINKEIDKIKNAIITINDWKVV